MSSNVRRSINLSDYWTRKKYNHNFPYDSLTKALFFLPRSPKFISTVWLYCKRRLLFTPTVPPQYPPFSVFVSARSGRSFSRSFANWFPVWFFMLRKYSFVSPFTFANYTFKTKHCRCTHLYFCVIISCNQFYLWDILKWKGDVSKTVWKVHWK